MILVLGAGGTVGSELVKRLVAEGTPFRAAHHSASKAGAARATGQDAVELDLARPDTLERALEGIGSMFLLSGNHPDQTSRELAAVSAAKRAGVSSIVKLSVWGAESEAFSFARIHRPVEQAIESSGIGFTFLRPNGFMQNFLHEAGNIRARGTFSQSSGWVPISYVDARDIAAVAAAALRDAESGGTKHAGASYTLSGPRAITCHEIAAMLGDALGRPIAFVERSPAEMRSGMLAAGVPAWYADNILDTLTYQSEGCASLITEAVRQVTGQDPTPFERFLVDHVGGFQ